MGLSIRVCVGSLPLVVVIDAVESSCTPKDSGRLVETKWEGEDDIDEDNDNEEKGRKNK